MKLRTELYRVKHDNSVTCVKLHGHIVISASWDRTIKVSNRNDGILLHTFKHDGWCFNFDMLGNQLSVAADDGIYIWSLSTQERIEKISLGDRVYDVRFQGRSIIAACLNGQVYAVKME